MAAGRRLAGALIPLLAALLAATAGSAPAQERSWHLRSFRAEILVRPDGAVLVTEVLRPEFRGSFRGIFRTIPVEYRTPAGFDYDLDFEVATVTDVTGEQLRHEISRDGRHVEVRVRVPGARDTVRTVRLRYRVDRAIRHHEGYDELYWNVTGTEWGVPIDTAAATIALPDGVSGVRVRSYTGPFGSRSSDAAVQRSDGRIRVATGRLEYGEGLTAAVAWDPGVVERPGLPERAAWFLGDNGMLLLPLLAAGAMFGLWYRRGRDPSPGSVPPRYEPPEGLSPAEVGVLADDRPDLRDVTATLVDLAVRGYVEIEARRESKLLGFSTEREYVFRRLRPPAEWDDDLRPHERSILEGLFEGGRQSVELSELEEDFYRHLSEIRDDILAALMERKLYRDRPDRVRRKYLLAGVLSAAGLLSVGLGLLGDVFSVAPLSAAIGSLGTGAVIAGFGWFMPIRTAAGTDAYGAVLGFEEFLERVEEDRFRRMITGPEMFEAFLPHALALGVEKRWARAFEELYRRPPEWYSGRTPSGFHAGVLAADLGRLSSEAGTAMSSRPRSSGGSAFSGGGGSSGGGFGGGGGGAF